MRRPVHTYCGPAAIASALGISRQEAATRLLARQPRSRGPFQWATVAYVLRMARATQETFIYWTHWKRPTLARWLRDDGRDAILFVSHHFVHVSGGRVVEDNGWACRRGRVRVVLFLRRE